MTAQPPTRIGGKTGVQVVRAAPAGVLNRPVRWRSHGRKRLHPSLPAYGGNNKEVGSYASVSGRQHMVAYCVTSIQTRPGGSVSGLPLSSVKVSGPWLSVEAQLPV